MRVNEIFLSLQGEGIYVGCPAVFIRTSGCNKSCEFCDSKYALSEYTELSYEKVAQRIIDIIEEYFSDKDTETPNWDLVIIFTGGEPTIYIDEIIKVINYIDDYIGYSFVYHLETNGTYLNPLLYTFFNYVCFSPKTLIDIENIWEFLDEYTYRRSHFNYDIKVVVDGIKLNSNLIHQATMVMPLTTFDEQKDKEIKEKVWNLCVKLGKRYSPRLQIDIFGDKRGV